MPELRTIEIDFDVHKIIELERNSFSETPNQVLRRLLKINEVSSTPKATQQTNVGRPWAGKGVTLPHRTELQMEYNGCRYTGMIDNGEWAVEGKRFQSPSAAAGGVALTKNGKRTKLDGWIYWHVKRPGDTEWISIKQLRP